MINLSYRNLEQQFTLKKSCITFLTSVPIPVLISVKNMECHYPLFIPLLCNGASYVGPVSRTRLCRACIKQRRVNLAGPYIKKKDSSVHFNIPIIYAFFIITTMMKNAKPRYKCIGFLQNSYIHSNKVIKTLRCFKVISFIVRKVIQRLQTTLSVNIFYFIIYGHSF